MGGIITDILDDPGRLLKNPFDDAQRDDIFSSSGRQYVQDATDKLTSSTPPRDVVVDQVERTRGGGGRRHGGPTPVMDYLMSQDPSLKPHQARMLARQFKQEQANPALAMFAQQNTNKPDPNTMQMFFAQTVAPYLKGVGQQMQAGQDAGVSALEHILTNSKDSPGLDVIRKWLPAQKAGGQALNAALQGATVTAPYYDQLLNQLQEGISQQQRSQAMMQQLAVAPTQQATGPTFGQQAKQAALAAGQG